MRSKQNEKSLKQTEVDDFSSTNNKIRIYNSLSEISTISKQYNLSAKKKRSFYFHNSKQRSSNKYQRRRSLQNQRLYTQPNQPKISVSEVYDFKTINHNNTPSKIRKKGSPSIIEKKVILQRNKYIKRKKSILGNKKIFLNQIECRQNFFIRLCRENRHQAALEMLLILLNYAIDLNLIKEFLVTLLHISKFLLLCKRYQESISYFQQTKKCSKMMLEYVCLIECYIGLGRCSYQINLNEESINFLQKGLEYAWYKNDTEKEIIIYDMIGLNYYKLGNIDKAKIYHQKYTQGLIESKNSIRKIICDSKIKDMENKSKIFKPINIDLQLLLQLNIQIFSLDKLSSLNHKTTLRKEFKLEQDYHKEFKKKQLQIQTILQQQQFNERIVEQNYVKDKYIQKIQSKTSTYHEIESAFKRKIQMLKKKNKYRVETQRTISFKQKKTLQEQIEIRLNRDSKNEDWYKKLTDQICRDRTFNLRTIKDKVLFKQDTKQRNKLEIFKVFIKSYFQSILELP